MHSFCKVSALCILLAALFQQTVSALYMTDLTRNFIKRSSGPACNTSTAWQPTPQAYINANTDKNFASFSSSHQSGNQRLDKAFGSLLGELNFQCGIDTSTECTIPDCFSIQNRGLDPWVYLAANSFDNLNTMFDTIWDGFNIGSDAVQNMIDNLADNFFQWKQNPTSLGQEIAHWVTFAVSIVTGPWLQVVEKAIWRLAISESPAFTSAITEQIALSLKPSNGISRNTGIEALHDYILSYSNITRTTIDTLADTTFAGQNDSHGHSLRDYIAGGRFVNSSSVPHASTVSSFYQTMLTAKIINLLWRAYPVYLLSTTANNTALDHSLNNMTWQSRNTSRLYVPYYYQKGKVVALQGSNLLNGSFYNIAMTQVTASSAKAWEIAGYSYTDDMALASVSNASATAANSSANPWLEQAGFQGVFRIPVCDIGSRSNWVVPYGSKVLPCCCGPNCRDTRAFIQAVNLNTTGAWLSACKKQLQGTDLNFTLIDYGIKS